MDIPITIPTTTYIIIGASFLFAIIVIALVMRKFSPMMKAAKQMMDTQTKANLLRTNGIASKAVVLNVQPTGKIINYAPVVGMTLQVTPPQGNEPPYQVHIENAVAQIHMPQVQPNATVPVKINPNDPQDVVLDL